MAEEQTDAATAAVEAASGATRAQAPMVIGLLFWVFVIGVVVFLYVHEEEAQVFLDVTGAPSAFQGRVVYKGNPADGVLHILVADPRSRKLIYSATLDVKAGVLPTTSIRADALAEDAARHPLRIDADFRGTAKAGKNDEAVAVRGATTVFLNVSPPLSRQIVYWSIASIAIFGTVLTFLITGSMGPAKAHMLFAFMYLATFLSLAMPIALSAWVAQNPFLREKMQEAPIGIVLARGEGATQPQWLINIGGKVLPGAEARQKEAQAIVAPVPDSAKDITTPQTGATEPTRSAQTDTASAAGNDARVVGGLTVPFFVVMLAMFGAGVNLTRKVPGIQREYYKFLGKEQPSFIAATGVAIAGLFKGRGAAEDEGAAEIRRKLVQNIMYFAAAPFLGIAVYYLLRMLATEVTQPALVITAFATGLVSDKIVEKVIEVAERTLGTSGEEKEKEKEGDSGAPRRPTPAREGAPKEASQSAAKKAGEPGSEQDAPKG